MSMKHVGVAELEDLEKPAADLPSEEAAKASGGVILMPVLPTLELFEVKGMTFPTSSDTNADRQTKP